ncbi:MAG: putative drug exporter of the superfamily [Actinomycetota bacterium]|nr:putative drug exporter of the superfamily [Actinomycetota bacterium]
MTGLPSGRRTKFVTLAFWLILISVAAPFGIKLTEAVDNDAINSLPNSAEATKVYEESKDAFPGSDKLVAVIAYAREGGLTDADTAKVEADRAAFTQYADGGQIQPAYPSEDGKALMLTFPITGDTKEQQESASDIKESVDDNVPGGLEVGFTGSAGAVDDVYDAFGGIDGKLVLVTASVVALILLLTYRSLFLWFIPLLCVGMASQLASAVVYLLAEHGGLVVNFQSQTLLTVLVFGVGTDYALLLISRYREELRRHRDRHQAMNVALRRSFGAILASGATVALGLMCLLAADLNSTRGLGPVCTVGIIAGLLSMLTLLPALLVLCGRWVFWPFVPRYVEPGSGRDVTEVHGLWNGIARVVGRRPRSIWVGSAAVLAVLTVGAGNLSLGLPWTETFTDDVGSVTGQHLIEKHYPAGSTYPVQIVTGTESKDTVVRAIESNDQIAGVDTQNIQTSQDGRRVLIQAVLAPAADSQAAKDTIDDLRDELHAVPGAQAIVGGDTATTLDTERAASRDNKVIIPLIILVVFLVLILLLRAVVAPVLLVASVVLSFAAAMGASGLIFDMIGHPKIDYGMPLQAFLFLVALGVDYTIFLMTRAREETKTLGHPAGVLPALAMTGGVIASAGLVLAATFASLSVMPLVPSLQMGIVVAVGVLLDTFLVMSLLVPALSVDVGRKIWWPSPLSRSDHRAEVRPEELTKAL